MINSLSSHESAPACNKTTVSIPFPARQTALTIKIIHRSHQITRAHRRNGAAGMKNARPLPQLILSIPRTNNILHTGIKRTLRKTYIQPIKTKALISSQKQIERDKTYRRKTSTHKPDSRSSTEPATSSRPSTPPILKRQTPPGHSGLCFNDTRTYLHGRNPYRRPHAREYDVARDLPDHITDRPRRRHVIQLVTEHA